MDPIMEFLKELRNDINQLRNEMNQRFDELQNEIKMTQQGVFDTGDRITASVQDLEHRLDAHRVKFTRIEEDLHILKEKQ